MHVLALGNFFRNCACNTAVSLVRALDVDCPCDCAACWRCDLFKFFRDGGDYEAIVKKIYNRLGLAVPGPGCRATIAADQDYDIFFSLFVQDFGLQQKFQIDSIHQWTCNGCSVQKLEFSAEDYFFCFTPILSIEDSLVAPRDILINRTCDCSGEVKGVGRLIQSGKFLWFRIIRSNNTDLVDVPAAINVKGVRYDTIALACFQPGHWYSVIRRGCVWFYVSDTLVEGGTSLEAIVTRHNLKGRFRASRRRRRGCVLIIGDSNTTHKDFLTPSFIINSGGGARFSDVHRLLRHRPMVGIRAVVFALGINHRPDTDPQGIIKTVQEAVDQVKRVLPGPPIFHLAVPVQKAPREFAAFLSAVNFHLRTVMPQIPHPMPENSRLHYSPRERRAVQAAVLRFIEDRGL